MSCTPHGKHLIAGQWVGTQQTFQSEAAHGAAHAFSIGTLELVNRAANAAEEAFWSFGYSSCEERAAFLDTSAEEIEASCVGTMAIRRFLRPVSYQNIPMGVLPEDLR
jgi:NADP-dependent aldehyde dehydrogenase